MLIPLPLHGQSSTDCVEAMFAELAVLASIGKYPLGQNPAFQKFAAPLRIQEIWAAYRDPRFARSCIVCGTHITMMSHDQYLSQVRSTDLAQLEESDISPMILRSLVAGRDPLPGSHSYVRRARWCKHILKRRCFYMES